MGYDVRSTCGAGPYARKFPSYNLRLQDPLMKRPRLSKAQRVRELTRLKKVGLYSGDVKKAAEGSYGRELIHKFLPFLSGKAKTITYKTKEQARRIGKASGVVVRGRKILIEKPKINGLTGHIFSRKGKLFTVVNFPGGKYTIEHIPKAKKLEQLQALKKGQTYIIIRGDGGVATLTRQDLDEMQAGTKYKTRQENDKVLKRVLPHLNILLDSGENWDDEDEQEY
jgi:hypothetical protein